MSTVDFAAVQGALSPEAFEALMAQLQGAIANPENAAKFEGALLKSSKKLADESRMSLLEKRTGEIMDSARTALNEIAAGFPSDAFALATIAPNKMSVVSNKLTRQQDMDVLSAMCGAIGTFELPSKFQFVWIWKNGAQEALSLGTATVKKSGKVNDNSAFSWPRDDKGIKLDCFDRQTDARLTSCNDICDALGIPYYQTGLSEERAEVLRRKGFTIVENRKGKLTVEGKQAGIAVKLYQTANAAAFADRFRFVPRSK